MLIVCPTCANEYNVATDHIGASGRVVRCAACRGAWFVPPGEGDIAIADSPRDENPFAPARRRRPQPPTPAPGPGNKALLALTLGLAAALALGIALRTTIVRAVPQSGAAFAALGLPVNLIGLTLGDVSSELANEASGRTLLVRGEIVNATGHPIAIPPLAFEIEGRRGDVLYAWSDRTQRGEIGARETRSFQVRLPSPPPESQRLAVAFSTRGSPSPVASR